MPITCQEQLSPLTREEFGPLSYELMGEVLAIRQKLGRFFDEKHYKRALALQRPDILLEVPVSVCYQTFEKCYFLDALLAAGAILEFKATESLTPRHRAQLLHYQMLTGLPCGLLINVRPEKITREYVNCVLRPQERYEFRLVTQHWQQGLPGAQDFYTVLGELLHEWGNGLELSLYEEALTHFLGGEDKVLRPVKVYWQGAPLGDQLFRLAADRIAFKLTAFETETSHAHFVPHAQRLLEHTALDALLWANLGRNEITFHTLKAGG